MTLHVRPTYWNERGLHILPKELVEGVVMVEQPAVGWCQSKAMKFLRAI